MAEPSSVFSDYVQNDVYELFQRVHPRSWQELIDYLRNHGLEAGQATPRKAAHMIADATAAMRAGIPFPDRWDEIHAEMRSHRNPDLVHEEERRWRQTRR